MHPQAAVLTHHYLDIAFIVILFYDYLITLPIEVELIWKRARSRGSMWYLGIRYFTLAGFIVIFFSNLSSLTHKQCDIFHVLHQALMCVIGIMVSVLFAMRTYALYDQSKRLLIYLVLLMVGLLVPAGWALSTQHLSTANPDESSSIIYGCHQKTSRDQAWRMMVAWGCLGVFDLALFALTAARAIQRSSLPFRLKDFASYTDLVLVIYRDVAIYFFVMLIFNIATAVCFFVASDMFRSAMATPTSVVSAIMCTRLILNIREATSTISWAQSGYQMSPTHHSTSYDPGIAERGHGWKS